ncbi:HEPN domain-containing protein [uncultured Dubosiella sp.]|uniref:HEPN domain-containing protein n=2 Tax=uncultured Dubosiella sp. TaxID=1937011 RepID=UPI002596EBD5|nr:HEPN domain-containing protein [uncultured Dubosiella sp.]
MAFIGNMKLWEVEYLFIKEDGDLSLYRLEAKNKYFPIKIVGNILEKIHSKVIVGYDRSGKTIVFYVEDFPENEEDFKQDEYHFSVTEYIILNNRQSSICGISFYGPEINCMYPPYNTIEKSMRSDDNQWEFTLKKFSELNTKKTTFKVDNQTVEVFFGMEITKAYNPTKQPIMINSFLRFKFEETNDYRMIQKLCRFGKEFLQFLWYRRNIHFNKIEMKGIIYKKKSGKIGEFRFEKSNYPIETFPLEKNRCISIKEFEGHEGEILQEIADGNLYNIHISESYQDSHLITEGKFVLITSAFEWTYKRIYSNQNMQSEERKQANEAAINELEKLKKNSMGREKKWYKKFINEIKSDHQESLQSKIERVGKDYENVLGRYCEGMALRLKTNNFDFVEIGEEIAHQRNNFAHGNIDKEFKEEALPAVIILEYMVYCMQLRSFGFSDEQIISSINQLFNPVLLSEYDFSDTKRVEED